MADGWTDWERRVDETGLERWDCHGNSYDWLSVAFFAAGARGFERDGWRFWGFYPDPGPEKPYPTREVAQSAALAWHARFCRDVEQWSEECDLLNEIDWESLSDKKRRAAVRALRDIGVISKSA